MIMQQVIKKPVIVKLYELSFIFRLNERPAPISQAEIDRLPQGWELKSESTRAKMARIGI